MTNFGWVKLPANLLLPSLISGELNCLLSSLLFLKEYFLFGTLFKKVNMIIGKAKNFKIIANF